MNAEVNSVMIYVAVGIWLVIGAAFDFLKVVLKYAGQYLSATSEIAKDTSADIKTSTAGFEEKKIQVVSDFIKTIENALGAITKSLVSWASNFLKQVVERDENIVSDENNSTSLINTDQSEKKYIVSVFDNTPENKYAGQKVIGALLEFVALSAFLYADSAQAAQTFSLFYPGQQIPDLLNNIVVPLIVASAGTAFILGIFIGDVLQLTHFGSWGKLNDKQRKTFLRVVISNLVFSITLAGVVAFYKTDILGVENETVRTIAIYAQNLIIVPMLITTTLLLRGAFGLFVIVSIALWLLAIPFATLNFFTSLLGRFIDLGVVSVDFLFRKIIWLVFASFELLFKILEHALRGSFLVLISLTTIIFFIPYLLFNLPIQKYGDGKRLIDIVSYENQLEDISLELE